MNELALFAGAGGGILASNLLGIDTVCAVELDEYCQHILMQRQNEGTIDPFPIWDDVRTFAGTSWRGTIDLVSGGFPCQAFSSAARGRNKLEKDEWSSMLRIIKEVQPKVVFAENVSRKAIQKSREDLLEIGFRANIIELSAKDLGADHKRRRFWLFAYTDSYCEFCRKEYAKAQSLPEFRGGFWEAFAGEFRVSDGVAHRLDRLKAAGNGQVPIVAATAFIRGYEMMIVDDYWEQGI